MFITCIILFCASYVFLDAQMPAANEDPCIRRIFAYLKIGEYECGLKEAMQAIAKEAIGRDPNASSAEAVLLQEGLIRLLAKSGREIECYHAWNKYEASFTNQDLRRDLLEEMAWGTIHKGLSSPTLYARLMSLVGATITQDAYALPIMQKCLRDSNSLIRTVAVELSSHLMDLTLQKEVLSLLKKDPVWEVRMQAIDSIAKMKLKEAEEYLKTLLVSKSTPAEEQARIVACLVSLVDEISLDNIVYFAKCDRAGLRLLACAMSLEAATKKSCDSSSYLLPIIPLINDPHAEVRIAALNLFGLTRMKTISGKCMEDLIAPSLQDCDFRVAITASWLMTLMNPERGMQSFIPWFSHKNQKIRCLAAAALGATGKYGIELALKLMKTSCDPFVRTALARALIGQRVEVDAACNEIYHFLMDNKALWMWDEKLNPLFQVLAPSDLRHNIGQVLTPEVVDQKVRLDLIHVLAVLEYPKAQDTIKTFLKEKTFGITGLAATMLVQECDKEAALLVRELLYDLDPKIRVQAALVLGMWIHDKEAVAVLQQAYPQADRELKIKILEAVANIGDPDSINFLLNAMQDPFSVVRIVAAAALIICLNH